MDISKRNHYLPQFYLHQFVQSNDNSIFRVYYKGEKKPRTQTPVNTGIEKHLYNVKGADGSFDDSVELLSRACGVFSHLEHLSRLPNKDQHKVALMSLESNWKRDDLSTRWRSILSLCLARNALLYPLVGPGIIKVRLILFHHPMQVSLAQDEA